MYGRKLSASSDLNFDDEAKKLWAALNLDEGRKSGAYNALDSIYKHPITGGCVFVGGKSAIDNIETLRANNIEFVLNCTDNISQYFEESKTLPKINYLRHDMGSWWRHVDDSDTSMVKFISVPLAFVMGAIHSGKNVIIHCLAGAHRAGTMGIVSVSFFAGLRVAEAEKIAKIARPIINPIGFFPRLLEKYQSVMDKGMLDDLVTAHKKSIASPPSHY